MKKLIALINACCADSAARDGAGAVRSDSGDFPGQCQMVAPITVSACRSLMLMTVLTLLPAALMAMTSFTRIIVVLAILRQALGLMSTPSNQIILGLALFMTVYSSWRRCLKPPIRTASSPI